jgi:MFS family permease
MFANIVKEVIMFKLVKEVFSVRNVAVISFTSSLYQVFNQLWNLWWSLYLLNVMEAPIFVVGLISTVQSSSQILFQLPGGVLADRIGRKKVIILGTTLRIIGPVLLLLAPSWEWVIPGMIFNAMSALYMPAFNAIIADSLPRERRGTAYGVYRTVTSIPNIVMPILSGIYIDAMGLEKGVKTGLLLYIGAAILAMSLRAIFLRETLSRDGDSTTRSSVRESLGSDARTLMGNFRGTLLVMLLVACISGFTMRMVYPYLVIYGVEVIGLTKSQWGALQTIASGLMTCFYLVGGMMSDRIGRIPNILIARSILPLESLGLVFLHGYNQLVLLFVFLGIGGGFGGGGIRGGGGMGGPSWQALIADIVPQRDRGKVLGLMGTMTGLINLPAPIIGAYLWEVFGPDKLLLIGSGVGLMVTPLILFFIKEPEEKAT